MALKGSYRYPLKKIDKLDDYLEILIVDYVPPGLELTDNPSILQRTSTEALDASGNLKNPLYQILLPMPQGISDSNLVKWGQDEINPLEAAGVGAATEAMQGNPRGAFDTLLNKTKPLKSFKNERTTIIRIV